jgi:hypothetical protein
MARRQSAGVIVTTAEFGDDLLLLLQLLTDTRIQQLDQSVPLTPSPSLCRAANACKAVVVSGLQ